MIGCDFSYSEHTTCFLSPRSVPTVILILLYVFSMRAALIMIERDDITTQKNQPSHHILPVMPDKKNIGSRNCLAAPRDLIRLNGIN